MTVFLAMSEFELKKIFTWVLEKNNLDNFVRKMTEGSPEELTENDLTYYKYAPIISTDVERSFFRYKNILTDNRRAIPRQKYKKKHRPYNATIYFCFKCKIKLWK